MKLKYEVPKFTHVGADGLYGYLKGLDDSGAITYQNSTVGSQNIIVEVTLTDPTREKKIDFTFRNDYAARRISEAA